MKTPTKKEIILINLLITAIGLVMILVGILLAQPSWLTTLLDAVGIGLIAAGLVNAVDHILRAEPKEAAASMLVAKERHSIPQVFYNNKYQAKKIDLLAVSMTDCLKEFVRDPGQNMVDRIMFTPTRLRILFVHPDADFMKQRAFEDHLQAQEMRGLQLDTVVLCLQFFAQLWQRYDSERSRNPDFKPVGSVEVKLVDFCPYVTLYRVDEKMYWGLYTSHTEGKNLPLFVAQEDEEDGLFEHLKQHFYKLLQNDLESPAEDHFLIRMTTRTEPRLNRVLAEALLDDPAQVARLLPERYLVTHPLPVLVPRHP